MMMMMMMMMIIIIIIIIILIIPVDDVYGESQCESSPGSSDEYIG